MCVCEKRRDNNEREERASREEQERRSRNQILSTTMSSATDKDHSNCEEMMKMTITSNTKAQKLIDSIDL